MFTLNVCEANSRDGNPHSNIYPCGLSSRPCSNYQQMFGFTPGKESDFYVYPCTPGTKRKKQSFRLRSSISGAGASWAIFPVLLSHFIRGRTLAVDMCPAYRRRQEIHQDFRPYSSGPAAQYVPIVKVPVNLKYVRDGVGHAELMEIPRGRQGCRRGRRLTMIPSRVTELQCYRVCTRQRRNKMKVARRFLKTACYRVEPKSTVDE